MPDDDGHSEQPGIFDGMALMMDGALFDVGAALGFLIPETRKKKEWISCAASKPLQESRSRSIPYNSFEK